MKLIDKIGHAFLGNCCARCEAVMDIYSEYEVCPECDKILRSYLQDKAIVIDDISIAADKFLFFYTNRDVRKIVLDMKEQPLKQHCRYFARLASECIEKDPVFSDIDIVTYCPRKPSKERIVGYDHSRFFAEYISEFSGIPFQKLIKRREGGREQKKLKHARDRLKNISGKFYFDSKLSCRHKTVLLVDDIITSGYTVKECAHILKEAGATRVLALFILN